MAYREFSSGIDGHSQAPGTQTSHLTIDGQTVDLPDASFVKDAHITKDGMNLVLEGPHGTVVVDGYFSAEHAPNLVAPGGATLTPNLVDSFTTGDAKFASNESASDVSPVGAAQEVTGHATVTHHDGTVETLVKGTPIFEGDIVQTDAAGAVNIVFADQTSFAVSEDARLAIDKYVYDPTTQSGSTDFSILKGVFVFTSGLIGRDDPDDVKIDTPAGSIGIRGTIIAGNVHTGEITVVEGAIVLHDFQGHEITLASQFDTAKFTPGDGGGIEHVGQLSATDINARFASVSHVSPNLFSSINDAAHDGGHTDGTQGATDGNTGTDDGNAPKGADDHSAAQPDVPAPAGDHAAPPAGQAAQGPAPGDAATGPAPVLLGTMSGFGNSSGFGHLGLTGNAPMAMAGSGMNSGPIGPGPMGPAGFFGPNPPPPPGGMVNGTAAGTAGDHPPPPPFDPNAGGSTGPTNHAPFHFFETPPEYFAAAQSDYWRYHFLMDFGDPDFGTGDTLHFELDNLTINGDGASILGLNDLTNDGAGPNVDILQSAQGQGIIGVAGDEGRGWEFNTNTGELQLWMNPSFVGQVAVGDSLDFNINIRAVDSHGVPSLFQTYLFSAYHSTDVWTTGTFTLDSKVVVPSTGPVTGTISGDNNIFLYDVMAGNNDNITVDNTGSGNTASGNKINLGGGNDIITIFDDAFDNRVMGGEGNDTFVLRNARVQAFGMYGDDKFVLDLTNGPNLLNELNIAGSQTMIDGGTSDFRAGHVLKNTYGLNTEGTMGGRGDTLELQGAGSLDFHNVVPTNKITGIERIDLETSTAGQALVLRYNDVLNLTGPEQKHTLIINIGIGDTLNLEGSEFNTANMHKVLDDVSIDDGVEGTPSMKDYDVFSDGNVTLLIHNAAGQGVVNMDGASVTI